MRVAVGEGSCGIASGAGTVYETLKKALKNSEILTVTGCIGMCFLEPIVDFTDDAGRLYRLVQVDSEKAEKIAAIINSGKYEALSEFAITPGDEEFLNKQTRIALRNCGIINPEKIEEYIERGGYEALKKVLSVQKPEEVIETIKLSGLAGRGGAGFPTYFKWQAARDAVSPDGQKYLICNADEGDPGAFMDRAVIESDPHNLIEGMLIASYAIGASEAIVYVRAEYPLAVKRLTNAITQAKENNLLGKNILHSGFSCEITVKQGAGAFVCGEETALIESLEGKRGMPRLKPPYPAQSGYRNRPSNINNVETFANVAWIIANGGEAFAAMGTENSKGTKVFALTGKIKKGGLVEIPMGKTLREVIFDIGGGIKNNKKFKAVQLGGPSGGCIPAELLDTVIDYKALSATGAIMGSGGMVVMDEDTCMVNMAKFFLDFTAGESCGKCVPCRIGTTRMQEILAKIVAGKAVENDLALLKELCTVVKDGALCGLGQTAPNPVLTTLKYFEKEYYEHISNNRCTAKVCRDLLSYTIDENKCIGCGKCKKNCPAKAVSGEAKKAHEIDKTKCVSCGKCFENCPVGAIECI